MNALIVDECEELRTALSLLLLTKGYKIFISKNGVEALNILKMSDVKFDLLLTDFNIPKMSGSELIKEIINSKLKVKKIVVLSTMANDEQHLKPILANNSHIKFLHKMTTTEKLLKLIGS